MAGFFIHFVSCMHLIFKHACLEEEGPIDVMDSFQGKPQRSNDPRKHGTSRAVFVTYSRGLALHHISPFLAYAC